MQRNAMFRVVTAAAAVAVLAACAGVDGRGEGERSARVSTDCINTRQAQDFRVLDDRTLVVFAPSRSQPYLVELGPTCQGLRFEHSIGLSSRGDRFCGFAGDAVLLRGGVPERCPVLSVRRLDQPAYEELLGRFDGPVPDDLGDDAAGEISIEIPRADDDVVDAEND